MVWINAFRRQPKWLVLVEALVLVGMIGWFDHVTGWAWSCFAPYAVPIVLVTWMVGRHAGFAFAVLCALAYWLADYANNPFESPEEYLLTALVWWFYFSVLVVAVAALSTQRKIDRARIAALERTQRLEQEIIEIADQEKERLGRELHDGLCQTLAGISALSITLSKKLEASSEAAAAEAAEITGLLQESIGEARNLARGLGPVNLEQTGLARALESLAANIQNQFRVTCAFACDPTVTWPAQEVALHLLRITQQAVNNALAHGKGRRIQISLTGQGRQGRLTIQDDGVGLPAGGPNAEGCGIRTMSYRARLIGASLEVRPGDSCGVEVVCIFPLSKPAGPCENSDPSACQPN